MQMECRSLNVVRGSLTVDNDLDETGSTQGFVKSVNQNLKMSKKFKKKKD